MQTVVFRRPAHVTDTHDAAGPVYGNACRIRIDTVEICVRRFVLYNRDGYHFSC